MRRVGPVNRDEFFVAITWKILSRGPGLKFRLLKSAPYFFSKWLLLMFQSFFHQFGLVATLLLQLHGLLYVYITYRHQVNKRLSIYYAVKRTIAQKVQPALRVYVILKMLMSFLRRKTVRC